MDGDGTAAYGGRHNLPTLQFPCRYTTARRARTHMLLYTFTLNAGFGGTHARGVRCWMIKLTPRDDHLPVLVLYPLPHPRLAPCRLCPHCTASPPALHIVNKRPMCCFLFSASIVLRVSVDAAHYQAGRTGRSVAHLPAYRARTTAPRHYHGVGHAYPARHTFAPYLLPAMPRRTFCPPVLPQPGLQPSPTSCQRPKLLLCWTGLWVVHYGATALHGFTDLRCLTPPCTPHYLPAHFTHATPPRTPRAQFYALPVTADLWSTQFIFCAADMYRHRTLTYLTPDVS